MMDNIIKEYFFKKIDNKEEVTTSFLLPSIYAIELTTVCNNFCSGCANVLLSRAKKDRKNNIEYLTRWKELVDIVAPDAKLIRLTGGEPTLHREFGAIVKYIDDLKIPHTLFTTGRWTVNKADKIIKSYQDSEYFVGMLVSLHGSTKEAHNAFVESIDTAFEETCRNIKLASKAGLDVFTNVVLTKYNCGQIMDIIRLSMRLGAKHIVFNRYLGAPHDCEPNKEELREAIILIESLREEGFPCYIGNLVPPCFVDNSTSASKSGVQLCNISPSGMVRPDNFIHQGFGNIFETDIETIWNSATMKAFRGYLPMGCRSCAAANYCQGGVKSVLIEHGMVADALKEDPLSYFTPVPCRNTLDKLALSDD